MSQRTEKVESVVRQAVASRLIDSLSRDAGRVSVSGVDVSPDLRACTVWIDIYGDDKTELFAEVTGLQVELQRAVASTLTTKYVPRLTLKLDTGGDYAAHISRLLKND